MYRKYPEKDISLFPSLRARMGLRSVNAQIYEIFLMFKYFFSFFRG